MQRIINFTNPVYCLLIVLVFSGIIRIQAQDYHNGIGIRLGSDQQGFSVKHFINETSALEGLLSFSHRSLLITGLYEKQQPVRGAQGLSWFYGAGVHIGFYNDGYDSYYYKYHGNRVYIEDHQSHTLVGIDLILGLEYNFSNAPITLGLDLKPYFDFSDGFYGNWDGALTGRFTF